MVMGSYYDTMQVCKKWGHKITETYSNTQFRQDFCDKCGSQTTHVCEECQSNIKGYYHVDGVIGFGGHKDVPLHCHKCGSQYPWKWRLLLVRTLQQLVAPFKYVVDTVMSWFKR